jgi:hypothetical protein
MDILWTTLRPTEALIFKFFAYNHKFKTPINLNLIIFGNCFIANKSINYFVYCNTSLISPRYKVIFYRLFVFQIFPVFNNHIATEED